MNISISGPFEHRNGKITGFDHGTVYPVATVTTSGRITTEGKKAIGDLLASAPELLEALEPIEKALSDYISLCVSMNPAAKHAGQGKEVIALRDKARAAIAKATGN